MLLLAHGDIVNRICNPNSISDLSFWEVGVGSWQSFADTRGSPTVASVVYAPNTWPPLESRDVLSSFCGQLTKSDCMSFLGPLIIPNVSSTWTMAMKMVNCSAHFVTILKPCSHFNWSVHFFGEITKLQIGCALVRGIPPDFSWWEGHEK